MLEIPSDTREALEESLYDLKHDLGKYVRLPVSMLPKDASWDEVAAQTAQAVLRTRTGPSGTVSAVMLMERFHAEWGATLADQPAYREVQAAVASVCALPDQVQKPDPNLTREKVEAVLAEVSQTIQRLMDEVAHG
jgi:hypothetical protein